MDVDPDALNNFYVEICTVDNSANLTQSKPEHINPKNVNFTLVPFNEYGLVDAWRKTKNHNNVPCDHLGICNKMINLAMEIPKFTWCLTYFFNNFVEDEYVPDFLKISKIVPVPKADKVTSPNQTRPVSIQSVLTKILDKCLYRQLSHYVERNNLINPA